MWEGARPNGGSDVRMCGRKLAVKRDDRGEPGRTHFFHVGQRKSARQSSILRNSRPLKLLGLESLTLTQPDIRSSPPYCPLCQASRFWV